MSETIKTVAPEKLIADGKVAVLISPGFGAGWSTWNSPSDFLLFDKGLVELAQAGADSIKVDAYLKTVLGEDHEVYFGGWPCVVEWLPIGTQFTVHEYDGSESIRSVEDLTITA